MFLRSSSSRDRGGERDRNDRGFDRFERREGRDGGGRPAITKRSFSRESQERGGEGRGPTEPVRRVSSMTDDRVRRDRAASKDPAGRERFHWFWVMQRPGYNPGIIVKLVDHS